MLRLHPAISDRPRPLLLGPSNVGSNVWTESRDTVASPTIDDPAPETIKQIVEDHHDRHARTISFMKVS